MNRPLAVAGSLSLAVMLSLAFAAPAAHAAAKKKVDCDAVMSELNSGKKPKEVAADLKISVSSVRRCKKKAKAAASGMAPMPAAAPSGAPASK